MTPRFIEIFIKDSDLVKSVNINHIIKIEPFKDKDGRESCLVYLNEIVGVSTSVSNISYKAMKELLQP